jgi:hypothetical protein
MELALKIEASCKFSQHPQAVPHTVLYIKRRQGPGIKIEGKRQEVAEEIGCSLYLN